MLLKLYFLYCLPQSLILVPEVYLYRREVYSKQIKNKIRYYYTWLCAWPHNNYDIRFMFIEFEGEPFFVANIQKHECVVDKPNRNNTNVLKINIWIQSVLAEGCVYRFALERNQRCTPNYVTFRVHLVCPFSSGQAQNITVHDIP